MHRFLSAIIVLCLFAIPAFAQENENVEVIYSHSYWGYTYDCLVYNDIAYISTQNSGVVIVDISDMDNPVELSTIAQDTAPGYMYLIDNYLYLSHETGINIYNISDQDNPELVNTLNRIDYVYGFHLNGNYLYTAEGTYGMSIIDVSEPFNPFEVGYCDTDGRALDVEISANYAFVADDSEGIKIIDISDPSDPDIVGNVLTEDYPRNRYGLNHLVMENNLLYFTSENTGFAIYDISDPFNATEIYSSDSYHWSYDIDVVDNYAYISSYSGLDIYDISNPANPDSISNYPGDMEGFTVSGDHIFASLNRNGIAILNIEDPSDPYLQSELHSSNRMYDVTISDNYAIVSGRSDGLQIFDITNIYSPDVIFKDANLCEAQTTNVDGNRLYIASGNEGLTIADFTDPTNITVLGNQDTRGGAALAIPRGNTVFVADQYNSVALIDVTDPSDPDEIYSYLDDIPYCNDIIIEGNIAYLACGYRGLRILDIEDPLDPVILGELRGTSIYSIRKSDNLIWTAGLYSSSCVAIDVSDLNSPEIVLTTDLYISDCAVVDHFAAMVYEGGGIYIYDISNLENIEQVGYYNNQHYDANIEFYGEYLVVADIYNFLILDISQALGVNDEPLYSEVPTEFSIAKAYPNPFNPTLNVDITLPQSSDLSVVVYNINGQLVSTLTNQHFNAGSHTFMLNGTSLSSGVYFINASAPGLQNQTQKVMLVK